MDKQITSFPRDFGQSAMIVNKQDICQLITKHLSDMLQNISYSVDQTVARKNCSCVSTTLLLVKFRRFLA